MVRTLVIDDDIGVCRALAAFLNQGRQIGIRENVGVCVHITSTAMHYHIGSCFGPVWLGPGSDASGNVKAPSGIALTTTADPVFNYLGAATPAATYTVRNPDQPAPTTWR